MVKNNVALSKFITFIFATRFHQKTNKTEERTINEHLILHGHNKEQNGLLGREGQQPSRGALLAA
jgi:hypothetical protein